jgi:V8-like Glu-specific endopeptidase
MLATTSGKTKLLQMKQTPPKKAAHYYSILARKQKLRKIFLEGIREEEPTAGFEESDVPDRLKASEQALHNIIEDYLDNDSELKKLADQILKEGGDSLRAVANLDDTYLNNNPGSGQLLEVIVNTDGSRPSFLIKDDKVDINSSPLGDWNGELAASADELKKTIRCVGRININQRHVGTGFLVGRNLILTNRHVLQAVTEDNNNSDNGPWIFKQGAHIDFGHEFRAQESVNPRSLIRLIYCGPQFIDRQHVNHQKLDLALIELEPVEDDMVPLHILQWDDSTAWVKEGKKIWTIGYPGDPGAAGIINYSASLLEKLFRSLYGFKRLAPGEIISKITADQPLTADHDATTLGGNSGSVVVVAGLETIASGLHYGGEVTNPRQNWAHVLGLALEKISDSDKTVYEFLQREVKFFL